MKAIFLCAGYGTRLYPLTKDCPKSLLLIAGEALLNHLVRKLEAIPELDHIILISNARFYEQFVQWQKQFKTSCKISVINDGTSDNEHRLGAIQDLKLGMNLVPGSDLLVLAGDNLFDSNLSPFIQYAQSKSSPTIGFYDVHDRELAKKYGLIKTDSSGKIMAFFEKPSDPPTTLASMGIYYLPQDTLNLVDRYLAENQNPDAPGFYISWLANKTDVYAFPFHGAWFDIGDLSSYYKADEFFKTIKKK